MEEPQSIYLKHKPANRAQRRAMEHEYLKLQPLLDQVEEHFGKAILNGSPFEYARQYQIHLEWWNKLCHYIVTELKPKYCNINAMYFKDVYYPVENAKA